MTTTALNGLFQYILSLNLSKRNSKWLAEKILESTENKSTPEIAKIPEENRCDPYEIIPSGDPFFADKRNVEFVRKRLEDAQHSDPNTLVRTKSREEIEKLIESL